MPLAQVDQKLGLMDAAACCWLRYVLIDRLRVLAIQGTERATAQIETLRNKLDPARYQKPIFTQFWWALRP